VVERKYISIIGNDKNYKIFVPDDNATFSWQWKTGYS